MRNVQTKRAKDKKLTIRISTWDMNRIRMLADMYSAGNVSLWVTNAALDIDRRFLKKRGGNA